MYTYAIVMLPKKRTVNAKSKTGILIYNYEKCVAYASDIPTLNKHF